MTSEAKMGVCVCVFFSSAGFVGKGHTLKLRGKEFGTCCQNGFKKMGVVFVVFVFLSQNPVSIQPIRTPNNKNTFFIA